MDKTAKIAMELEPSELYQIILSIACRQSICTSKWACATSKEEEALSQSYITYLNDLNIKLKNILSEATKDEKNGK